MERGELGNLNKVEWLRDCGPGQNCNSKDKLVIYNCSLPHCWITVMWLAHIVKMLKMVVLNVGFIYYYV